MAREVPPLELLEAQLAVVVDVGLDEGLLRRDLRELVRSHVLHLLGHLRLHLVEEAVDRAEVAGHLVERDEAVTIGVVECEGRTDTVLAATAAEDREAARAIQETVTTRANSHLTFGYYEKAIVAFHQQLHHMLAEQE